MSKTLRGRAIMQMGEFYVFGWIQILSRIDTGIEKTNKFRKVFFEQL